MPCFDFETNFPVRILESASSMMAYWDKDLYCRYANRVYEKWFGKPGSQLVGTTLQQLLGPELFALNEPYIRAALTGHSQTFERIIPGPDGIRRHSLARYHPDVVDGAVVGFIAEICDVGVLKQLEAMLQAEIATKHRTLLALKRKDTALEAAQELGRMGSWKWEIETDITTWSTGLYRLFGRNPGQLPPTFAEHSELYTPASWERLQDAVLIAKTHGIPYVLELEYHRADGRTGWLEACGQIERDIDGAIVGLHGTVQDITQRHELFASLHSQTRRLELALDVAQLGIWLWNPRTNIVSWENIRVREILAVCPVDSDHADAEKFFDQLIHPEDLATFHEARIAFFERGEQKFIFKGRILHGGTGLCRWVECIGRAIETPEGDKAMVGAVTDVTHSVRNRELLQSTVTDLQRANENKSEFLFTLAHELRNFLSPVSAGLKVLQGNPSDDSIKKISEVMERQLTLMNRLIKDIVDVRRVQSGALQVERLPVSVQKVIHEAVTICKPTIQQAGQALHVELPDTQIMINGDEGRLIQVLVNILGNASKFTPRCGSINIALTAREGRAILSVSDTGNGMLPEALKTVFGLYSQATDDLRSKAGLGIGLYLVHKLVQLHDGEVSAFSQGLGMGTTITISLPFVQESTSDMQAI